MARGRPKGSKNYTGDITHRVCASCSENLPLELFSRNKTKPLGRDYVCKTCRRGRERESMYGITPQEYAQRLLDQGGVCAICGKSCMTGKALAVDHDHDTLEVRGLLCGKCNQAIGLLHHDTDLLLSAIVYLKKGG